MRLYCKIVSVIVSLAILVNMITTPLVVLAWGDNSANGREEYTVDEINSGALGPVGGNAKESPDYPGVIVFNSISDSVIGHEFNYVGARECVQRADGEWEGATKNTVWNANDITVEDGKTYIIRMYVHNNNPWGYDAVAENTRVAFNVPVVTAKTIKINGYIRSSNATPSEYVDNVNFNSDVPFHLEYIYGSALLENNGIGLGGLVLSDDIVEAKDGGILVGYDALDGRVPGCYEYANYISIKVKVVFDYEFNTEVKVRLADSEDKTWHNSIDAKVGDKVEFQIQYKNTSNESQQNVMICNVLPKNLKYVDGSTIIINTKFPDGVKVVENTITTNGLNIGHYAAGANAYLRFTTEVVDNSLADGSNTLVNWAQAGVGERTIQDYASVMVEKDDVTLWPVIILGVLFLACIVSFIILLLKILKWKQLHK